MPSPETSPLSPPSSPLQSPGPPEQSPPQPTIESLQQTIAEKDQVIQLREAQIRGLRAIQSRQAIEIGRLRRIAGQQVQSLAAALGSENLAAAVTAAIEAASENGL